MGWFKYVWIVILAIIWIIWTVEAFIDLKWLIEDSKKHGTEIAMREYGAEIGAWAITHFMVLFVASILYFFLS